MGISTDTDRDGHGPPWEFFRATAFFSHWLHRGFENFPSHFMMASATFNSTREFPFFSLSMKAWRKRTGLWPKGMALRDCRSHDTRSDEIQRTHTNPCDQNKLKNKSATLHRRVCAATPSGEEESKDTAESDTTESLGAPSKQDVSFTNIREARMAQYFGNIWDIVLVIKKGGEGSVANIPIGEMPNGEIRHARTYRVFPTYGSERSWRSRYSLPLE